MKRHVLAALLPLLLAGCQTASEVDCKPATSNSNLQANASASQAGMTALLKSGAINQKASGWEMELRPIAKGSALNGMAMQLSY